MFADILAEDCAVQRRLIEAFRDLVTSGDERSVPESERAHGCEYSQVSQ
jgi:hypothetical protein